MRDYPRGARATVFYNPDRPMESCLRRARFSCGSFVWLVAGLAALAMAIFAVRGGEMRRPSWVPDRRTARPYTAAQALCVTALLWLLGGAFTGASLLVLVVGPPDLGTTATTDAEVRFTRVAYSGKSQRPFVVCRYRVDGLEYTVRETVVDAKPYAEGTTTAMRYNPRAPGVSVLEAEATRAWSGGDWIAGFVMLGFGAAGLAGGALLYRRLRR